MLQTHVSTMTPEVCDPSGGSAPRSLRAAEPNLDAFDTLPSELGSCLNDVSIPPTRHIQPISLFAEQWKAPIGERLADTKMILNRKKASELQDVKYRLALLQRDQQTTHDTVERSPQIVSTPDGNDEA